MGSCPALGGREAEPGKSPAGESGRVAEKLVPRILEEQPPSPPPVPPCPHRASAAGTGPPSGSLRAPSLAQHDGLGAAAAGTAVPAGGARTGAGARGSRGPGGTAGLSSRLWPEPGLLRPRAHQSRCACAGAGGGELGPEGLRGVWGRGRVVGLTARPQPPGETVLGGLRPRAWGEGRL